MLLQKQRLLRDTNTAGSPGMKMMGVGIINNKATPWRKDLAKKLSHSASQEITHLSRKLKVHYCVHKSPSLNPIPSSLMLTDLVILITLNISK
jgi:hypothetical protein